MADAPAANTTKNNFSFAYTGSFNNNNNNNNNAPQNNDFLHFKVPFSGVSDNLVQQIYNFNYESVLENIQKEEIDPLSLVLCDLESIKKMFFIHLSIFNNNNSNSNSSASRYNQDHFFSAIDENKNNDEMKTYQMHLDHETTRFYASNAGKFGSSNNNNNNNKNKSTISVFNNTALQKEEEVFISAWNRLYPCLASDAAAGADFDDENNENNNKINNNANYKFNFSKVIAHCLYDYETRVCQFSEKIQKSRFESWKQNAQTNFSRTQTTTTTTTKNNNNNNNSSSSKNMMGATGNGGSKRNYNNNAKSVFNDLLERVFHTSNTNTTATTTGGAAAHNALLREGGKHSKNQNANASGNQTSDNEIHYNLEEVTMQDIQTKRPWEIVRPPAYLLSETEAIYGNNANINKSTRDEITSVKTENVQNNKTEDDNPVGVSNNNNNKYETYPARPRPSLYDQNIWEIDVFNELTEMVLTEEKRKMFLTKETATAATTRNNGNETWLSRGASEGASPSGKINDNIENNKNNDAEVNHNLVYNTTAEKLNEMNLKIPMTIFVYIISRVFFQIYYLKYFPFAIFLRTFVDPYYFSDYNLCFPDAYNLNYIQNSSSDTNAAATQNSSRNAEHTSHGGDSASARRPEEEDHYYTNKETYIRFHEKYEERIKHMFVNNNTTGSNITSHGGHHHRPSGHHASSSKEQMTAKIEKENYISILYLLMPPLKETYEGSGKIENIKHGWGAFLPEDEDVQLNLPPPTYRGKQSSTRKTNTNANSPNFAFHNRTAPEKAHRRFIRFYYQYLSFRKEIKYLVSLAMQQCRTAAVQLYYEIVRIESANSGASNTMNMGPGGVGGDGHHFYFQNSQCVAWQSLTSCLLEKAEIINHKSKSTEIMVLQNLIYNNTTNNGSGGGKKNVFSFSDRFVLSPFPSSNFHNTYNICGPNSNNNAGLVERIARYNGVMISVQHAQLPLLLYQKLKREADENFFLAAEATTNNNNNNNNNNDSVFSASSSYFSPPFVLIESERPNTYTAFGTLSLTIPLFHLHVHPLQTFFNLNYNAHGNNNNNNNNNNHSSEERVAVDYNDYIRGSPSANNNNINSNKSGHAGHTTKGSDRNNGNMFHSTEKENEMTLAVSVFHLFSGQGTNRGHRTNNSNNLNSNNNNNNNYNSHTNYNSYNTNVNVNEGNPFYKQLQQNVKFKHLCVTAHRDLYLRVYSMFHANTSNLITNTSKNKSSSSSDQNSKTNISNSYNNLPVHSELAYIKCEETVTAMEWLGAADILFLLSRNNNINNNNNAETENSEGEGSKNNSIIPFYYKQLLLLAYRDGTIVAFNLHDALLLSKYPFSVPSSATSTMVNNNSNNNNNLNSTNHSHNTTHSYNDSINNGTNANEAVSNFNSRKESVLVDCKEYVLAAINTNNNNNNNYSTSSESRHAALEGQMVTSIIVTETGYILASSQDGTISIMQLTRVDDRGRTHANHNFQRQSHPQSSSNHNNNNNNNSSVKPHFHELNRKSYYHYSRESLNGSTNTHANTYNNNNTFSDMNDNNRDYHFEFVLLKKHTNLNKGPIKKMVYSSFKNIVLFTTSVVFSVAATSGIDASGGNSNNNNGSNGCHKLYVLSNVINIRATTAATSAVANGEGQSAQMTALNNNNNNNNHVSSHVLELADVTAPHQKQIVFIEIVDPLDKIISVDETGLVKIWSLNLYEVMFSFVALNKELSGGGSASASQGGHGSSDRDDAKKRKNKKSNGQAVLAAHNNGGEDEDESEDDNSDGGNPNNRNGFNLYEVHNTALARKNKNPANATTTFRSQNTNRSKLMPLQSVVFNYYDQKLILKGFHNFLLCLFKKGETEVVAHNDFVFQTDSVLFPLPLFHEHYMRAPTNMSSANAKRRLLQSNQSTSRGQNMNHNNNTNASADVRIKEDYFYAINHHNYVLSFSATEIRLWSSQNGLLLLGIKINNSLAPPPASGESGHKKQQQHGGGGGGSHGTLNDEANNDTNEENNAKAGAGTNSGGNGADGRRPTSGSGNYKMTVGALDAYKRPPPSVNKIIHKMLSPRSNTTNENRKTKSTLASTSADGSGSKKGVHRGGSGSKSNPNYRFVFDIDDQLEIRTSQGTSQLVLLCACTGAYQCTLLSATLSVLPSSPTYASTATKTKNQNSGPSTAGVHRNGAMAATTTATTTPLFHFFICCGLSNGHVRIYDSADGRLVHTFVTTSPSVEDAAAAATASAAVYIKKLIQQEEEENGQDERGEEPDDFESRGETDGENNHNTTNNSNYYSDDRSAKKERMAGSSQERQEENERTETERQLLALSPPTKNKQTPTASRGGSQNVSATRSVLQKSPITMDELTEMILLLIATTAPSETQPPPRQSLDNHPSSINQTIINNINHKEPIFIYFLEEQSEVLVIYAEGVFRYFSVLFNNNNANANTNTTKTDNNNNNNNNMMYLKPYASFVFIPSFIVEKSIQYLVAQKRKMLNLTLHHHNNNHNNNNNMNANTTATAAATSATAVGGTRSLLQYVNENNTETIHNNNNNTNNTKGENKNGSHVLCLETDAVQLVCVNPFLQLIAVVLITGHVYIYDLQNGNADPSSATAPPSSPSNTIYNSHEKQVLILSFSIPSMLSIQCVSFASAYPLFMVVTDSPPPAHNNKNNNNYMSDHNNNLVFFYALPSAKCSQMFDSFYKMVQSDKLMRAFPFNKTDDTITPTTTDNNKNNNNNNNDSGEKKKNGASSDEGPLLWVYPFQINHQYETASGQSNDASDDDKNAPNKDNHNNNNNNNNNVYYQNSRSSNSIVSTIFFEPFYCTLYIGTKNGFIVSFSLRTLFSAFQMEPIVLNCNQKTFFTEAEKRHFSFFYSRLNTKSYNQMCERVNLLYSNNNNNNNENAEMSSLIWGYFFIVFGMEEKSEADYTTSKSHYVSFESHYLHHKSDFATFMKLNGNNNNNNNDAPAYDGSAAAAASALSTPHRVIQTSASLNSNSSPLLKNKMNASANSSHDGLNGRRRTLHSILNLENFSLSDLLITFSILYDIVKRIYAYHNKRDADRNNNNNNNSNKINAYPKGSTRCLEDIMLDSIFEYKYNMRHDNTHNTTSADKKPLHHFLFENLREYSHDKNGNNSGSSSGSLLLNDAHIQSIREQILSALVYVKENASFNAPQDKNTHFNAPGPKSIYSFYLVELLFKRHTIYINDSSPLLLLSPPALLARARLENYYYYIMQQKQEREDKEKANNNNDSDNNNNTNNNHSNNHTNRHDADDGEETRLRVFKNNSHSNKWLSYGEDILPLLLSESLKHNHKANNNSSSSSSSGKSRILKEIEIINEIENTNLTYRNQNNNNNHNTFAIRQSIQKLKVNSINCNVNKKNQFIIIGNENGVCSIWVTFNAAKVMSFNNYNSFSLLYKQFHYASGAANNNNNINNNNNNNNLDQNSTNQNGTGIDTISADGESGDMNNINDSAVGGDGGGQHTNAKYKTNSKGSESVGDHKINSNEISLFFHQILEVGETIKKQFLRCHLKNKETTKRKLVEKEYNNYSSNNNSSSFANHITNIIEEDFLKHYEDEKELHLLQEEYQKRNFYHAQEKENAGGDLTSDDVNGEDDSNNGGGGAAGNKRSTNKKSECQPKTFAIKDISAMEVDDDIFTEANAHLLPHTSAFHYYYYYMKNYFDDPHNNNNNNNIVNNKNNISEGHQNSKASPETIFALKRYFASVAPVVQYYQNQYQTTSTHTSSNACDAYFDIINASNEPVLSVAHAHPYSGADTAADMSELDSDGFVLEDFFFILFNRHELAQVEACVPDVYFTAVDVALSALLHRLLYFFNNNNNNDPNNSGNHPETFAAANLNLTTTTTNNNNNNYNSNYNDGGNHTTFVLNEFHSFLKQRGATGAHGQTNNNNNNNNRKLLFDYRNYHLIAHMTTYYFHRLENENESEREWKRRRGARHQHTQGEPKHQTTGLVNDAEAEKRRRSSSNNKNNNNNNNNNNEIEDDDEEEEEKDENEMSLMSIHSEALSSAKRQRGKDKTLLRLRLEHQCSIALNDEQLIYVSFFYRFHTFRLCLQQDEDTKNATSEARNGNNNNSNNSQQKNKRTSPRKYSNSTDRGNQNKNADFVFINMCFSDSRYDQKVNENMLNAIFNQTVSDAKKINNIKPNNIPKPTTVTTTTSAVNINFNNNNNNNNNYNNSDQFEKCSHLNPWLSQCVMLRPHLFYTLSRPSTMHEENKTNFNTNWSNSLTHKMDSNHHSNNQNKINVSVINFVSADCSQPTTPTPTAALSAVVSPIRSSAAVATSPTRTTTTTDNNNKNSDVEQNVDRSHQDNARNYEGEGVAHFNTGKRNSDTAVFYVTEPALLTPIKQQPQHEKTNNNKNENKDNNGDDVAAAARSSSVSSSSSSCGLATLNDTMQSTATTTTTNNNNNTNRTTINKNNMTLTMSVNNNFTEAELYVMRGNPKRRPFSLQQTGLASRPRPRREEASTTTLTPSSNNNNNFNNNNNNKKTNASSLLFTPSPPPSASRRPFSANPTSSSSLPAAATTKQNFIQSQTYYYKHGDDATKAAPAPSAPAPPPKSNIQTKRPASCVSRMYNLGNNNNNNNNNNNRNDAISLKREAPRRSPSTGAAGSVTTGADAAIAVSLRSRQQTQLNLLLKNTSK